MVGADSSGDFWSGLVDWAGPIVDRSPLVRIAHILAPVLAAAAFGVAGIVSGGVAWAWTIGAVILLLAIAAGDVIGDRYRAGLREEDNNAAAAQLVALRDALRPIAEAIADIHTLAPRLRQERANGIAQRSADALALIMRTVPGFRSVVYRQSPDENVLSVLARAGRSEREPHEFRRGDPRGDAAFSTVEQREPCFVRDVNDHEEVGELDGAYSGTRVGYSTFISAPIADGQKTYGMVTVDAPNVGDLLRSDQHLVMLVADLLAIAFAISS